MAAHRTSRLREEIKAFLESPEQKKIEEKMAARSIRKRAVMKRYQILQKNRKPSHLPAARFKQ